jgi:hypothetical protein
MSKKLLFFNLKKKMLLGMGTLVGPGDDQVKY